MDMFFKCKCHTPSKIWSSPGRDIGSTLNLGGRTLGGTFLKRKGQLLEIKRALLCLLQILEGTWSSASPVPTSMIAGQGVLVYFYFVLHLLLKGYLSNVQTA